MSTEFHTVATVAEVAPDSVIQVSIGDETIALFNLGGEFYAIDGICSHGAAELADGYIEGDLIECPQHAGSFEIRTGKAVGYPCVVDQKAYAVKVEDGNVLVGIDSTT
jgi:nitrite reductase/ring-hydroxylating ferredoxin subunit